MDVLDFIISVLTSNGGAFGIVCALVLAILYLVHWVTKKITTIVVEHESVKKSIEKVDNVIDDIRKDLTFLKGTFEIIKNNTNTNNSLVQSHSPISLTEKGKEIASSMGIEDMVSSNWDKIQTCIEKNVPTCNAYDIQQFCIETATIALNNFFGDEDVTKIKNFAYQAGQNTAYYGGMIGVIIRDKYLTIKQISIEEVDKHDPNKK